MTNVVGYVPGAWDMFHSGHLNILRRARSKCDYLIVGAVTDESIRRVKHKDPIIPLVDRMAILAELRLVDEVVVDDSVDKTEMWHKLRFDVLFKGDDWRGTPQGDRLEAGMAEIGAQVVYFPYTGGISSSEIRGRLADEIRRDLRAA